MNRRQRLRKGLTLFSFFLFPATYYYFSPYLVIDATLKGIVSGSLIVFALQFSSALFFGRAFCGWLCPAAGCQESLFAVNDQRVTRGNWIKWLIWVPWISTIAVLALKNRGYERVDFLYQTTYGLSIGNVYALGGYFLVLFVLIVLPASVLGKRSFCHHLCWMAPFMILGRRIRNQASWVSLRLEASPDKCIQCHTCTAHCPMSLPVEDMVQGKAMESSECILCGTCVDGCRQGVISFSFF